MFQCDVLPLGKGIRKDIFNDQMCLSRTTALVSDKNKSKSHNLYVTLRVVRVTCIARDRNGVPPTECCSRKGGGKQ